jgi:NitT/TauT family transport system permease protein
VTTVATLTDDEGLDDEPPRSGRLQRALAAVGSSDTAWFVGALALAVVAWEVFVRLANTPDYLLPAPSVILETAVAQRNALLIHTLVTTREVVLGFALAFALGVPIAAGIAYSKVIDRVISPLLVAFQTIPKVALAPLFVVWLGHGLFPKIVVAFAIAFFPIVIDTAVGLRSANPGTVELVKSMGASRWQTFSKVQFPGALPNIFGGLEVAITLAVIGAVVGEYISADQGLGYLQLTAAGILNTPLMFAAILVMSLLGLVLFRSIQVAEHFIIPWHSERNRG